MIRAAADSRRNHLVSRVAVLVHEINQIAARRVEMTDAQARDYAQAELLSKGIATLNQVVQEVSEANLSRLTDLVNTALRHIFFDQELEFRIVSEEKWNMTVYRFEVLHDGVPGNQNSFGGGIYAVIALVLKIVFNRYTKRYPMIVGDESLHFVSGEYVARTSAFMQELSRDFDMKFVLITHEPRFAAAADQNYRASDGGKEAGTLFNLRAVAQ